VVGKKIVVLGGVEIVFHLNFQNSIKYPRNENTVFYTGCQQTFKNSCKVVENA
jgi:hypothetical protein